MVDRSDDYERTYEEFWKEIVEKPDGTLNLDQLKRELHDYYRFSNFCSIVYDHVTGGVCSKPTTLPEVVKNLADDHVTELVEERIKDEREPLTVDPEARKRHLTEVLKLCTDEERHELFGAWCRGCGGTLPCTCMRDE